MCHTTFPVKVDLHLGKDIFKRNQVHLLIWGEDRGVVNEIATEVGKAKKWTGLFCNFMQNILGNNSHKISHKMVWRGAKLFVWYKRRIQFLIYLTGEGINYKLLDGTKFLAEAHTVICIMKYCYLYNEILSAFKFVM